MVFVATVKLVSVSPTEDDLDFVRTTFVSDPKGGISSWYSDLQPSATIQVLVLKMVLVATVKLVSVDTLL
ncbi:hypothetical protein HDU67_004107 [Dinochytrium kinnereticum]|nr:hypothetical protein HDU67_004107 [Dinochytrium kinnereticum]